jgi:hypothetical protein
MNDNLAIQDPLADKPVTILITLEPDNPSRDGRTAIITVGVKGEPPVFGCGAFEDVAGLINQAWLAFGVRQQTTISVTQTETVAEVKVAEEPSIEPDANAGATPSTTEVLRPSRPQPQNLSLF